MNFKKEVVKFSILLEQKGFVNAMEGNISAYDRENSILYISPSGKAKLFLDEDVIAVINAEGDQIEGTLKRSSEYLLHQAVYEARPDCNGAIHCHCPYLTAYAVCQKPFRMDYYPEFLAMFGEIPVQPFGLPGTPDIHENINKLLEKSNIVLLANHGVICVGKDIEEAAKLLEAAEAAAHVNALARQLGDPVTLSEDVFQLITSLFAK
ncbi:MAG: class II aldolase/adducin family protein [Bacillota bacterium]